MSYFYYNANPEGKSEPDPAQYPSWNNCGCRNNNNYCCA